MSDPLGGLMDMEAAAASDSPAEPQATPAAAPPEEPAAQPGRVRDDSGRFTKAEGSPPQPETPLEAREATPGSPPPTDVADEFQPFSLNDQVVEGALVDTTGDVFIPKESLDAFGKLVGDAQAGAQQWQKRWQDDRAMHGREVAEARREGQETLARAHRLMQTMDEVFASQDQNAILDFAQNWLLNKPRIEAETRAQLAEQRLQESQRAESSRLTQQQEAELVPLKQAAVDEWTEKLAKARGFSDADIRELKDRYRGWGEKLFAVENGQVVIVYRDIDADLAYLAKRMAPGVAKGRTVTTPPVAAARGAPSAKPPAKKPETNARASVKDRDAEIFKEAFSH